jgi:hypothetical protein
MKIEKIKVRPLKKRMLSDKWTCENPQKTIHYIPRDITKQIIEAMLQRLGYIKL